MVRTPWMCIVAGICISCQSGAVQHPTAKLPAVVADWTATALCSGIDQFPPSINTKILDLRRDLGTAAKAADEDMAWKQFVAILIAAVSHQGPPLLGHFDSYRVCLNASSMGVAGHIDTRWRELLAQLSDTLQAPRCAGKTEDCREASASCEFARGLAETTAPARRHRLMHAIEMKQTSQSAWQRETDDEEYRQMEDLLGMVRVRRIPLWRDSAWGYRDLEYGSAQQLTSAQVDWLNALLPLCFSAQALSAADTVRASIAVLLANSAVVEAAGQDFINAVKTYHRTPDEQAARNALCQKVRRCFSLETREVESK